MDELKNITELTDAEIEQVYGGFKFWRWFRKEAKKIFKKAVIGGITKVVGALPVLLVTTGLQIYNMTKNKKKEDTGSGSALDTGDSRDFHAH